MDKDNQFSSGSTKREDDYNKRFLLLSTKMPSDMLKAVSILLYPI